ncbi:hypothetical protein D3C72_171170 [compost metagenome]
MNANWYDESMQTVDSLTLAAVARELDARLSGARVEKIHVPTPTEMLWQLRGNREVFRLLFSVRGSFSRVHLTESRPDNPAQPPMFCMLLRKHLEGSRVLRVSQVGLERVLQIVTTGRDELGDPIERVLVAELTGKHSNLILLDRPDGTVLGSLRTVTASMSRERQIYAGIPYDPPPVPANRRDPRDVTGSDLLELLAQGGTVESAILGGMHSLSKIAIGQLCDDAGLSPKAPAQDVESEGLSRLAATWERGISNIRQGLFHAKRETGKAWDYRMLWTREEAPPPSDANALLDGYYRGIETGERLEALRATLAKDVKERLSKLATRQERIHEGVLAGERADEQKQWGELILAFGWGLPPGAKELEAPNHYLDDSPTIRIPLDSRLTPSENAQRYFRRYQKAKAGMEVSARLIAEGQEEIRYWESVATAIAQATRLEDLVEVRQELNPEVPTKGRPPRGTKKTPEAQPSRFVSSDGLEILVGRNNRQNDLLTLKLARPDDWWFHTQIIPGSHVLVRASGGELPERTRDEAAMLAAWYSQARASSKVPVVFTKKRFVKKPSGAKPGMVIYEQEKTLFVTPDAEAIARIAQDG